VATIRFDHIAIALHRMADAPAFLVGELGGEPKGGRMGGDAFSWGVWRFDGGGRIEILEPFGRNGFLHRFLAQRGPGIHHVTFKVPSLDEILERARAHGYTPVGRDDSDPYWKEGFLHPKESLGIVVQLAEAHRLPPGTPSRPWSPPPGLANPPPPVTVLGLRMRASSPERAQRQWEAVLQGQPSPGPKGEVVYRWPGSPMRSAVEVDPAGPEGPIAIEVATPRPLKLPKGPHPVLGTPFRQEV
jgi:methylmalonyl-CoA/ethylmalonyl-CoA epimerase